MSVIPNAGEYPIRAMNDSVADPNDVWVTVEHVPCEEFIFPVDDADELDVAALPALMAAHHCPLIAEGA
jgi:hypothetical protein